VKKSHTDIRDLELSALLEITQAINNNLSELDLYRIYRFTLLGDLQVKTFALFVKEMDEWQCKVHFGTMKNLGEFSLPEALFLIQKPVQQAFDDPLADFDLALPIIHKDRLLAIVFTKKSINIQEDLNTTFLRALTNILIVAIENKKLARRQLEQESYRKELEIAKKVQNFLFPKSLPLTSRLKIDAVYLPHQDVGGDYYDYIALEENKFLLCIADVSGKGVPAALLMSNFQASLRTLVRKTQKLDEIIHELNYATFVSSNAENFITFFIAIYDFDTNCLNYANCGHNPSAIFDDGGFKPLSEGTTVLGMFNPLPFLQTMEIYPNGDFLLFGYTDGITETFNLDGDQFGYDRLIDLLTRYQKQALPLLHQHIFTELDAFRKGVPFGDDLTMISCQVNK